MCSWDRSWINKKFEIIQLKHEVISFIYLKKTRNKFSKIKVIYKQNIGRRQTGAHDIKLGIKKKKRGKS